MAQELIAKFRVDFSQCAGDPALEKLIAELKQTVPGFERLWKRAELATSLRGRSIIQHQELGELSFDRSSYVPEGSSFLRVLMFIPRDASTAATVTSIARSLPTFCEPGERAAGIDDPIFRHPSRR
jgi:hypothetical protein